MGLRTQPAIRRRRRHDTFKLVVQSQTDEPVYIAGMRAVGIFGASLTAVGDLVIAVQSRGRSGRRVFVLSG